MKIVKNTELQYEQVLEIVDLAVQATTSIYGTTAKPSKLKVLASVAPAVAGNNMTFVAAAVNEQTGKVAGFTTGFVTPMLVEEGMGATSFLTHVDPAFESSGVGEALFNAFEDWATNLWRAVDIRMELVNPSNNEGVARALEARGYKRQGILMLKRNGGV